MTFASAWVRPVWCLNSVLNVKALVGAFNQEKALLGDLSVIVKSSVKVRLKLYQQPRS